MNINYAQTKLNINTKGSIFLAGPSPRDKDTLSWRPIAINMLEDLGFEGNVFIPEMEYGWESSFGYTAQIEWEEKALNKADVIMFWVPRELKKMPAFTTNIEWGSELLKFKAELSLLTRMSPFIPVPPSKLTTFMLLVVPSTGSRLGFPVG